MSTSEIFVGIGLIVGLAVGCQIVAARSGLPAIILLLPVGFAAGALITSVDPAKIFGAAFSPMVSLSVAIILFDGGLDLVSANLKGDDRRVVHRLRDLGIPLTWLGVALFAWPLLGLSWEAALMLGAILIVSGPTVVTPVLAAARPGARLTRILSYEGTTVDPIGATNLTRHERIFIGWMDPRGIVAASTASTFAAPLVALNLDGAGKLLPATFLVIVGTVAVYGLTAAPLATRLALREPERVAGASGGEP